MPRQSAMPCSVIQDRKSTRLNSSHPSISYAVFCLKKKNINVRRAPGAKENQVKRNPLLARRLQRDLLHRARLRHSFYECAEAHVYPLVFFFNDTATTEIYTLSLHDALPISSSPSLYVSRRSIRRRSTSPSRSSES